MSGERSRFTAGHAEAKCLERRKVTGGRRCNTSEDFVCVCRVHLVPLAPSAPSAQLESGWVQTDSADTSNMSRIDADLQSSSYVFRDPKGRKGRPDPEAPQGPW